MIEEAHDRSGTGRKREKFGERRGSHKLQYKWSEQNAGKDFSDNAGLLKPFGKIAQAMHGNKQKGDSEHEVTELDDRHFLPPEKRINEMSGRGFSLLGKSLPWTVLNYVQSHRAFFPPSFLRGAHAPTTRGSRDSSSSVLSLGTEHPGVKMNLLPATFLAACHWLRICSGERSL